MPIYEYECNDCGHQLEVMRKHSDDPLTACPSCGKEGLRKIISKVSFRLKGAGWYETDFKNKPSDKPAEAKTGDPDQAEKKATKEQPDSAGKDDKPATKANSAAKPAANKDE